MKILFVSDVPLEKPASGAEQMLNSQASRLADEDLEVYAITRQSGPPKCIIRDVSGVREGAYHASPRHLLSFMLSALEGVAVLAAILFLLRPDAYRVASCLLPSRLRA